jgi:hypothetical protein
MWMRRVRCEARSAIPGLGRAQGVGAEQQPALVEAVAAAAGRYGHVISPEAAHRPALETARALLEGPGAGWAARVFFSDNGCARVGGLAAARG